METYNLLVIDDDPNIRNLLTELLAGRNEFKLLIAGDGKEAVRQFAEHRIDMVLTDIHMPGFTGLELMGDMKKINFKPEILVMTANATPENVETARRLGARSVILKPFDDLEVIEAEINKALRAVKAARGHDAGDGNGNGHGASAAVTAAPAAPPSPPAAATRPPSDPPAKIAGAPPKSAGWAAPKPNLWPAPKPAASAPVPVAPPVPAPEMRTSAAPSVEATEIPESGAWSGELTGNETPPAAPPRPRAAMPPTPAEPVPRPTPPAPRSAPARPQAAPIRPAEPTPPERARPAPTAPAPATRPAAAAPAEPRPVPHAAPAPEPHDTTHSAPAAGHAPIAPPAQPAGPAGPAATAHPTPGELPEEEIPALPADLEEVFRTATSFDTGRLRMQVPIVCLQTWEEKQAIAALRRLAAERHREFYVWSAARGLVKEAGQGMGETYRDAGRALEFIRRQKNNGLYVLADFRPCLEDKTVVRVLREMVMDFETSRLMLVLTAPRLPAPPELAQACTTFDWPASGGADLNVLYHEVAAELAASTGSVVRLDPQAREQILGAVKDMPAGRARFEIARRLMSATRRS